MKKYKKIELEISNKGLKKLNKLAKDLRCKNITEVIKISVGLHIFLLNEIKKGNEIIVKGKKMDKVLMLNHAIIIDKKREE
jgi:hypothetical protein